MGFVQQGWVGQSRGKMPLPRFYWQPWAAPVGGFRGSGVPAAIQSQSRLEGAPTRRYDPDDARPIWRNLRNKQSPVCLSGPP